jgi:hypothetical protein
MTTEERQRQETENVQDDGSEPLFADDERSTLGSRWKEIQASFVDEPRQAVEQADALVSEVVEKLTTGFSETRSRLEDQWAKGEDASTEDLRVALTRYRSFFKRLLAA